MRKDTFTLAEIRELLKQWRGPRELATSKISKRDAYTDLIQIFTLACAEER